MSRRHRGGSPKNPPTDLCASVTEENLETVIRPIEGRARVLWCTEVREAHREPVELPEFSAQEALEEGLTVVEDLPERMPCILSYSAIGGGNACIRQRKEESYGAFIRRLRQTGETGEYFAKAATRSDLEKLGVTFPSEEDAEFGDTWLDG